MKQQAKRLVNWYFKKNPLPGWGVLLIDTTFIFFSYLFVSFISGETIHFVSLLLKILILAVIYVACFCMFHTYLGIFRYSSFVDLLRIGYSMLVGTLVALLTFLLFQNSSLDINISPIELLSASAIATICMWTIRIIVKSLHDASFASSNAINTFVYGVKSGGISIAKHIRSEKPMRFQLKGFISDDRQTEKHTLMGVKVHFLDNHIVEFMKESGIEALIISPFRLVAFRHNTKFQDQLIKAGIHIYMTQEEKEWGNDNDESSHPQLKEISIEDLLPREEIQVDMKVVAEQLANKCIMVTGSAGSIGSEMVRQIAAYHPSELVLIDQAETPQHDIRLMMQKEWPDIKAHVIVASICEPEYMETIFSRFKPYYVFHAAAYKHVPMMEDNPGESVHNNIYGTKVVADLAVKYGVKKFVMISTDKAVNPTNVMGCSKRICEIYVQSLNKQQTTTQFVTTRFGNVLGSSGSVIPLFKEQISKGGPITVTHPDIIRYFMLIPEACKLVLEAGTKGQGGEIFAFDMGQPVKIADLAKRMILLSEAKNVEIKYTGLRPGEKLYEEVLAEQEHTKPSFHQKIRIAQVREYDYDDINSQIEQLITVSKKFDDMETVRMMKQIVPEYKSNNSIYSKLDT